MKWYLLIAFFLFSQKLKGEVCVNHLNFTFDNKGYGHQLYFGKKNKTVELLGVQFPIPLDHEEYLEKVPSDDFSFYSMPEGGVKSVLNIGEVSHPAFLKAIENIQRTINDLSTTGNCSLYDFINEYSGAIDTKRHISAGRLNNVLGGFIYVAGVSRWGGESIARYFIKVQGKWYLVDYQTESP